ncbi:MAG: transposase [Nitrososphaerota archaeon]|nr:transposase [Nitrososphaerota archaeon]
MATWRFRILPDKSLSQTVKRHKPKRWVVERSASWVNRHRERLRRWEKITENYLGPVQLAYCIPVYR